MRSFGPMPLSLRRRRLPPSEPPAAGRRGDGSAEAARALPALSPPAPPPPRDWETALARWRAASLAAELQGARERVAAALRRWRRRLPGFVLVGGVLVVTVFETSGSLALTVLWAILLAIVGAWISRAPVDAQIRRELRSVRDRAAGAVGLARGAARARLARDLSAAGLLPRGAACTFGDTLAGRWNGVQVRIAPLSLRLKTPLDLDAQLRPVARDMDLRRLAVVLESAAPPGATLVGLGSWASLIRPPEAARRLPPAEHPEPALAGRVALFGEAAPGSAAADALAALTQRLPAAAGALGCRAAGAAAPLGLDFALQRGRLLAVADTDAAALDPGRLPDDDPATGPNDLEAAVAETLACLARCLHALDALTASGAESAPASGPPTDS